MKAKLIKNPEGYDTPYILTNMEDNLIASTEGKLSLKNCQAIENGYDLDELAYEKSWNEDSEKGFINGANAILEILGDKKFSEEDMAIMMLKSAAWTNDGGEINAEKLLNDTIQSLQQTEWDCIVEMEEVYDGLDEMAQPQYSKQPKLDADGCLILKRKSE